MWNASNCRSPGCSRASGCGYRRPKTWIAHPGRGIDVLRFTLKWRKIRGGGKWHGATMISGKSSRTIRQTIRN